MRGAFFESALNFFWHDAGKRPTAMFANGRYDVNDQTPTEIPKLGRIGRQAWLRGS
jgi:hypothetical protein